MEISEEQVAAIARAFDVEPLDVRADTPLEVIGWTGTATDWLVAAEHLDVVLAGDPPDTAVVATIADVIAIVTSSGGWRGENTH
jgi:hypothetical protein